MDIPQATHSQLQVSKNATLVEIDGDTFVPYPSTKCVDFDVREPVGDVLSPDTVAVVYQNATTQKLQFQLLHGTNF